MRARREVKMKEKIIEIITYAAPLVAGFITSVLIPFLIKRFSVKSLQKKIDEVNEAKELKDIKNELSHIKREILELRGKRK